MTRIRGNQGRPDTSHRFRRGAKGSNPWLAAIRDYEEVFEGLGFQQPALDELKDRFNRMHLITRRGCERGYIVGGYYVLDPNSGESIEQVNTRLKEIWGAIVNFELSAVASPPENEPVEETRQSLRTKKGLADLLRLQVRDGKAGVKPEGN